MKLKLNIAILALALPAANLFACGDALASQLSDLFSFSEQCSVDDTAKAAALRELGLTMGSNLGFSDRSAVIRDESTSLIIQLNRVINFSRFLDKDGWLPPVIEYVASSFETDGSEVKSSGEIYRIIAPAKFVMAPPTVRDYLFVGLPEKNQPLDPLPSALRPKNEAERKIWKDAVDRGYQEGIKSADATLEENIRKLKREYIGMMLYEKTYQKGMITRPMVASAKKDADITALSITKVPERKEFALHSTFTENVADWKKDTFMEDSK